MMSQSCGVFQLGLMQVVFLSFGIFPLSHLAHSVSPLSLATVPFGHVLHMPCSLPYRPKSHVLHEVAPELTVVSPNIHCIQLVATVPLLRYCPPPHTWHS